MIADMRKLPGWADLDKVLGKHPRRLEIDLRLMVLLSQMRAVAEAAVVERVLAGRPANDTPPLGSKDNSDAS